ncbi:MAG: carbohydrate kinase family protein, partial [Spirochaetaceae bacterium]|nr:carbohydrate kinase family protein [Spirochaetaceae bacterium]
FVNEIGAAASFLPSELGPAFLGADIVAFGGTALVPALHDGLPGLLAKAKSRGALTFVNTVFDFRAERRDPAGPWPLGGRLDRPGLPGPAASYRSCDLLVMDRDEALRLAGTRDLGLALAFFRASGIGAYLVTRGGESVLAWSGGGRFAPLGPTELPISERALRELSDPEREGDTTGCGDAFAGGALADIAMQLAEGRASGLDLVRATSWGIAGGAFTLSILGGTYIESRPGEKRELVASYRADWIRQAGRT